MPHIKRSLVLAAVLAGVAMPALAARGEADDRLAANRDGAVALVQDGAAPLRLADDDHDDDRKFRRRGHDESRDSRRHSRDHDDDDDDDHDDHDDDDNDHRGRGAGRPAGAAAAQNPLIGTPRANTN